MAITYAPTTNFGLKDSLPTNDSDKVIRGSEFTTEFTAIQTAFSLAAPNASPTFTGTVTIPTADINGGAIDGTTIGGTTPAAGSFTSLTVTTADINGGTIDGAIIGGATPAAITGTTLAANTSLALATGATVTAILDEDAMTSNSATALATQQSIKAYVDSQVTAQDLDVTTDSGTIAIDLDSETLTVAGGTGLDTSATGNTVTVAIDSTVATLTGAQTLTNKVLTSPDINTPDIDGGTIDGATIATSDITVGAGKTLDVSAGTLTLANDQISGDKIEGGTIGSVTITTADINGGSLDGTVIGAATPAAGSFTSLTATGTTTLAGASTTADITFGDNDKAIFGAGSDLQIYHDGSNSRIDDTGTGNLILRGSSAVSIQKYTGETLGVFNADGSVLLAYDNATKFETTATGIDVTGTVTADGLTVDGDVAIASDLPSITLTDNNNSSSRADIEYNFGYLALDADANNVDAAEAIDLKIGGTTHFRLATGGDISFYEDTGTTPKFFWDASAESLGIGTSSPSQDLHLYKQNAFLRIQNSDNNYALDLTSNGTVGEIRYSSDLKLMPGGIEAVTLKASGNVGIGTTSPTGMLTLDKDVATLYDATDDDAQRSGTTTLAITNENGTQNTFAQIAFDLAASGQSVARIVALNDGTSTSALAFVTEGSNTKREVMRLDGSGNVGIGTSSPGELLHLQVPTVGTGSGEVAIRMSVPSDIISAQNEIRSGVTSGTNPYMSFAIRETSSPFATVERMRIDSSGNLLVGTTSAVIANSSSNVGTAIGAGLVESARAGVVAQLNRHTSDGSILDFQKDGTTVGSIGTSGGSAYIGGYQNAGLYFNGTSDVRPWNTSTQANLDNSVDLGNSSSRFKDLYLSGGVYLGGTGAANLLDDYEEGTFTPVIQGATIAGIFTYGTQSGIYTKIGNAVHVYVAINVTATSVSPVGAVTIQGLPFTVSGSYQSLAVGWASGITFADQLNAYVPNAETFVVLRNSVSGGNGNQIAGSNLSSSFWIFVSGTYRA